MSFTSEDVSVVVVTRHRPAYVHDCLASLYALAKPPLEVIVTDNSDPHDDRTQKVVNKFTRVRYVRIAPGDNSLTRGRNDGWRMASGGIVAFIDDDVTVDPSWLDGCAEGYQDVKAGAVGGRVLDPEVEGSNYYREASICDVLADGSLTDNLECDPGKIIPVRHLRGCNFSCRHDVLDTLNGFDESIRGYGYEELDMCLRIGSVGMKILFNPRMSLYHHLSPRENRSRYDRYSF